jgi:hypothetical protein
MMNVRPHRGRFMWRAAYTIIELLALIFVIFIAIEVARHVADHHGLWAGVVAGVVSAGLCAIVVAIFYWAVGRQREQRRRELREKYRGVFRVIALPTDPNKIQKPEGAEIRTGDYGWEAEPLHEDGLIYLQGLTVTWRVVWHAGFRPEQIERIGPKPQSQYDWKYSWARTPPQCPFPVQVRITPDMGLAMAKSARVNVRL